MTLPTPFRLPLLLGTTLAGSAFGSALPSWVPTRAVTADATPQDKRTMRHDGQSRSYVVRAPRGLVRGSAPVPVVLVLHGGGGNAANAEQMTGFTALVERERILVVYPEGTAQRPRIPLLTWNATHCCAYAMKQKVDDVGFINALLDTLIATYPVDTSRIYVTGMSNGGMMSHRLGRELSHRVAAIAPVVGAVFGDEPPPAHAVSALMVNGVLDKSVPSAGGPGGGRGANQWDGTPTRPNVAQGTYWARANHCDDAPDVQESSVEVITRYRCPAGRRVELHQVKDNGHAWPGGKAGSRLGDTPTTAMNATDVIWAFFASVRKSP